MDYLETILTISQLQAIYMIQIGLFISAWLIALWYLLEWLKRSTVQI